MRLLLLLWNPNHAVIYNKYFVIVLFFLISSFPAAGLLSEDHTKLCWASRHRLTPGTEVRNLVRKWKTLDPGWNWRVLRANSNAASAKIKKRNLTKKKKVQGLKESFSFPCIYKNVTNILFYLLMNKYFIAFHLYNILSIQILMQYL